MTDAQKMLAEALLIHPKRGVYAAPLAPPNRVARLEREASSDPLSVLGEGYLQHWQAVRLVESGVIGKLVGMVNEIGKEYFYTVDNPQKVLKKLPDGEDAASIYNPANWVIQSIAQIGAAPRDSITVRDDLVSTGVKGNSLWPTGTLDVSRYREVPTRLIDNFPEEAAKHGVSWSALERATSDRADLIAPPPTKRDPLVPDGSGRSKA